ncbi:MAG: hypothetical protein Q8R98_21640, partial [Rubrivivax sp.]|nr:hypothetical protein [Rubrivivax sp.]
MSADAETATANVRGALTTAGALQARTNVDGGMSIAELLLAMLVCAGAAALTALSLGRDLNWDYFNYHGYAALSALGDRLGQDFMPAGYQGYLNPLPYLPLALMDRAGWSSPVIAVVLSLIQSLNALFLYLICRLPSARLGCSAWEAALLTALGCATLVLASQLGSTFIDPTTTPLVMAALWIALRRPGLHAAFWSLALCGAAVALKLTNAPFAIALLVALALCAPTESLRQRMRLLGVAALGCGIGFVALYGYWGFRLQQEFGSPVFPLFNNWFLAPDFAPVSTSFHRFSPQTALQALTLPLAMLEHKSWIYTEVMAPDLRPLALLLLLALLGFVTARRWLRRRAHHRAEQSQEAPAAAGFQAIQLLATFMLVATAAWLLTSGNGRYATPLLLLLGPMIFVTARAAVGQRNALRICAVLLALQLVHGASAGNPRWSPHPWTDRWLPISVPVTLKREAQLFVALGKSSESYLAAQVHPDSAFINPIGLTQLAEGGAGWHRFEDMRSRFEGRTHVLAPVPTDAGPEDVQRFVRTMQSVVDRLGLRIDEDQCQEILANNAQPISPSNSDGTERPIARRVLACRALPLQPQSTALAATRSQVNAVMDAFAAKCPGLFAPVQKTAEAGGRYWSRFYGKHDLDLTIDTVSGVILYAQERQA